MGLGQLPGAHRKAPILEQLTHYAVQFHSLNQTRHLAQTRSVAHKISQPHRRSPVASWPNMLSNDLLLIPLLTRAAFQNPLDLTVSRQLTCTARQPQTELWHSRALWTLRFDVPQRMNFVMIHPHRKMHTIHKSRNEPHDAVQPKADHGTDPKITCYHALDSS